MQEETNEKTIALYIKTGKLTAQQLQKAMKALLAQMKKQHEKQKIPHGKQTLKQLMKQNAGVSNIEITKDNIKAFESTAKKYGIDFALKKDSTETPPRYLVFFKGRDADALTAAFKEFSAKKLTQEQNPAMTDKNKLRYDVGLIVNGNPDIALDIRKIPDGIYAVFELPHTEQDITAFWSNIQKLVGSLSVDETKPVIERYPADKVAKHLCEFCIPLKKLS